MEANSDDVYALIVLLPCFCFLLFLLLKILDRMIGWLLCVARSFLPVCKPSSPANEKRLAELEHDFRSLSNRVDGMEELLFNRLAQIEERTTKSQSLNSHNEDVELTHPPIQYCAEGKEAQLGESSQIEVDRPDMQGSSTESGGQKLKNENDAIGTDNSQDHVPEITNPSVPASSPLEFDVFLSFRGEDTRRGFTTFLFNSLKENRKRVFMDTEGLERGEKISDRLLSAIESSAIAIAVFSKGYADSKWCLMELVKIVECGMLLLPIFYDIDPSDVRNQRGTFEKAFRKHEPVFGKEVTDKWRGALRKAGERSGFNLQTDANRVEANLIDMVVEKVNKEMNRILPPRLLPTPEIAGTSAIECQKQVIDLLKDPKVQKIGVWGAGGVGKTCIARNIYNHLNNADTRIFDHIIFVEVQYTDEQRSVRNEIKKQAFLRNVSDEENKLLAAASLNKRLQGRKFLLILDDLWKTIDLQELGVPQPDEQNGCKILVMTRNYEVCSSMRMQANVKVKPMPYNEAWDFFCEKVGGIPEVGLNSTARDIVRLCGGIPVGLTEVADFLKSQNDLCYWNIARIELFSSRPLNQRMAEQVFDRLRLSYDRLESQQLRDCLVACAFYVWKGNHMTDILALNFIAEGLIPMWDDARLDPAFHSCHHAIEKLKKASVVENVDSIANCIRMEGFMRSMTLHMKGDVVVDRNYGQLRFAPLLQAWEKAERISLRETSIETVPDNPHCPHLISLLLKCSHSIQQIPEPFFEKMENLRVLNLSCTPIRHLPTSLFKIPNLRYLDLGNCKNLHSIEGVGNLKNLLFLYLHGCPIEHLPLELSELSKLAILNIKNTKNLKQIPSGVISKLISIENLNMHESAYAWSLETEKAEMASLEELRRLPRLDKLGLTVARKEDFEYIRCAATEDWSGFGMLKCYVQESKETKEYDCVTKTWARAKTMKKQ